MQDEERVLMNRLIEAERRATHYEEACRAIEQSSAEPSAAHKIAVDALKFQVTKSAVHKEEA